jgi:hypothetical protein
VERASFVDRLVEPAVPCLLEPMDMLSPPKPARDRKLDATHRALLARIVEKEPTFTVEDDGVFTMPWSATITYWRSFDQWREFVCAESLRATYVIEDSAIPRADRPDF